MALAFKTAAGVHREPASKGGLARSSGRPALTAAEEPDIFGGAPGVTPTIVPVDLGGVVTDPQVATGPGPGDPSGSGEISSPAAGGAVAGSDVLAESQTRPEVQAARAGVFARTGAETKPLVRAGLAALALGVGLVVLGRRRRADAPSA